jgi:Ni/Co efflux regulator RcnB
LSKYAAITKGEKDLASRFKGALGLSGKPTEQEKSEELRRNAEREEAEHQNRMHKLGEAEEKEHSEEGKERVRKEVLYGRKKCVARYSHWKMYG